MWVEWSKHTCSLSNNLPDPSRPRDRSRRPAVAGEAERRIDRTSYRSVFVSTRQRDLIYQGKPGYLIGAVASEAGDTIAIFPP